MENLRRNFFNGIQEGDRKITWVKWHTVLAAKKFGGLGVSSFFALNRGLLAKWVWRFLSQDNSLWCQLIYAIHGSNITDLSTVLGFGYGLHTPVLEESVDHGGD
ncbi:hypothetical protein Tco_1047691 [Tanacetum coccineum]